MSSHNNHHPANLDEIIIGTPVVTVDGIALGNVEKLGEACVDVAAPGNDVYRLGIQEVRRIGTKAICVPMDAEALANHKLPIVSPDVEESAVRGSAGERDTHLARRRLSAFALIGASGAVCAAIGIATLGRRRRIQAVRKVSPGLVRSIGRVRRAVQLPFGTDQDASRLVRWSRRRGLHSGA
jgi:hypothetical protein